MSFLPTAKSWWRRERSADESVQKPRRKRTSESSALGSLSVSACQIKIYPRRLSNFDRPTMINSELISLYELHSDGLWMHRSAQREASWWLLQVHRGAQLRPLLLPLQGKAMQTRIEQGRSNVWSYAPMWPRRMWGQRQTEHNAKRNPRKIWKIWHDFSKFQKISDFSKKFKIWLNFLSRFSIHTHKILNFEKHFSRQNFWIKNGTKNTSSLKSTNLQS